MSKLEELIQQYCPDGVEWKPLAECCNILDGKRKPITKGARQSGPYPYYGANGIQDWVADYIFDGTYVLIGEDGSVITPNGTPIVNWAHGKIWVNNHAHIIAETTGVLLRFLFYYIQIIDIHNLVHGNIPKLTQGDLKEIEIPVPPLPVQEEIVRILDTFTELQAELQAELQKRKQQYNYYLDNLLNFKNINRGGYQAEVRWMMLKDIGKVCMCKRILKSQTSSSGDVPFFKIGTFGGNADAYISQALFNEYNAKYSYPQKGEVLISAAGTIGRTIVFDGTPSYFQDSNIVWLKHDESIVLNSYLIYCYALNPWVVSTGGTIARLYNDNILEATIPVPSLANQQRIVSILDRFDTITTDLTQGLPAEIEKRRQQYEYYRDKLLAFKRKGA